LRIYDTLRDDQFISADTEDVDPDWFEFHQRECTMSLSLYKLSH
jgi:hypothetical protein